MDKSISNIDDTSFTLPINIFTFNPCKEWLIFKLKIKGLYVDFQLICNELLYKGLTNDELGDVLTKIETLQKRNNTNERIVEIVLRYVEAKRTDKGIY